MTGYVVIAVLGVFALFGALTLRKYIYVCAPNEVLIFSGRRETRGKQARGYRAIKGGRGFRMPLIERVDPLDLTNMVIDVTAQNAYSKGGIPLIVQGVANVKVAGHEPVLHHAVVRFLGKQRGEIMKIAKATLEGSLRGILATMTPEQVNEDRLLFAERLVHEVEHDMTALGLVVDTLKIQHVHDELKYLDSIGRRKNADVIRHARIAEAEAQALSRINTAKNREREAQARLEAETAIARADANKALMEARSQREALIAEERAIVAAAVAQTRAGLEVQKARIEQVRNKYEAEMIEPAKAACQAAESRAAADAAPIVADGRARADVLSRLAESWRRAGPHARDVFVLQKLEAVIERLTDVVATTRVEQLTMINADRAQGSLPSGVFALVEQLGQALGLGPERNDAKARKRPAGSAAPRREAGLDDDPPTDELGSLDWLRDEPGSSPR